MNIHITKEEFDELMSDKIIGQFVIGSKLYGIDNVDSDTDYLVIMYPFKNKRYSAFTGRNQHQFQYKDVENNIDYNFVDVIDFIDNLVSGDSTVNYELLHSPEFQQNTEIGWLSEYIPHFRTYNIIKSYCGLIDRDCKHFNKRIGKDKMSGLTHIERGFCYAQDIFDNTFTLDKRKEKKHLKHLNKQNP